MYILVEEKHRSTLLGVPLLLHSPTRVFSPSAHPAPAPSPRRDLLSYFCAGAVLIFIIIVTYIQPVVLLSQPFALTKSCPVAARYFATSRAKKKHYAVRIFPRLDAACDPRISLHLFFLVSHPVPSSTLRIRTVPFLVFI